MIVQRFNLNLIPNQSPVIVHVNQYDTGTGRLVATLYEGNEPYSPNGTAVIQGTKPDGHGFQYTATLDGNVVTADLTEQMAPVAGDVRTQIVVTEPSGVTGTFAFIIRVQPSALPSDTDMSESDYQYIEEAIREAQEAVQTAQEATETAQEAVERAEAAITETQENAEDSEAWAQGTRGGIPVDPTDPTYEHNAEYWAQYAERYAQGGLHYKASIPFADIPTTGMREGDMYDITDDFTTDSRFTEGAGIKVKGGTNIAWNSDNKWDILALPYIPKTTFNGRSGSILPMAGDYDSKKILLSSALHIGGETQSDVQEALEALSDDGVKSFNGRNGSVLPMAGDYDSEKILLASVLHIGGETQENAQEALEALEGNKAEKVDNAIADNFAGLDANGNLKDSGKNAGDFATPSDIESVEVMYEEEIHGVNLLEVTASTQTINGVTFTVNSDGSVKVNGTATANTVFPLNLAIKSKLEENGKYILSGCPSGGATNKYKLDFRTVTASSSTDAIYNDIGEGVTFTLTNAQYSSYELGVAIRIENGFTVNNLTFYPMIRKADIEDSTYRPYNPQAIQNQINDVAENGAVNLLPNDATTQTINGVTFTVNKDSGGNVLNVTANGTASAEALLIVHHYTKDIKLSGNLILNGCPAGGTNETYQIYLQRRNADNTGWANPIYRDFGSGINVTIEDGRLFDVNILIRSGTTCNNLVFKPMISKPSYTGGYQPYAMTNRELTEKIKTIVSEAVTEAFSAHSAKWHDNANDCNVGFERTNDYRTSNMPTAGTASASLWYDIMTVRESNVSTSSAFGYGFQIAIQITTNSTMGDTYVRAVNGGATPTWSEWKKLN